MKNEYDNDQKQENQQLLLGLWIVEAKPIDEKERGEKGVIENIFKEIDEELNEYIAEGVSNGIWLIKVDESQCIIKIKDKLKAVFKVHNK